jgi:hypothetical protein
MIREQECIRQPIACLDVCTLLVQYSEPVLIQQPFQTALSNGHTR